MAVWSSLRGSTGSLPWSSGGAPRPGWGQAGLSADPAQCWSCQREGLGKWLLTEWDAGKGKTCSWSHAMCHSWGRAVEVATSGRRVPGLLTSVQRGGPAIQGAGPAGGLVPPAGRGPLRTDCGGPGEGGFRGNCRPPFRGSSHCAGPRGGEVQQKPPPPPPRRGSPLCPLLDGTLQSGHESQGLHLQVLNPKIIGHLLALDSVSPTAVWM